MSKSTNQISKPKKTKNLWSYIKNGPIKNVSLLPPGVACFLVVIYGLIKESFFTTVPQIYNYAILFAASIIIGSGGLIYIYRKEIPGLVSSETIKGIYAVIAGWLLLLFFWALGITGLMLALSE